MERLSKNAPAEKVTDKQKKELAELDSIYAAKIAERELLVKSQIQQAIAAQDAAAYEQLNKQLVSDRVTLTAEREEKKERARQKKS